MSETTTMFRYVTPGTELPEGSEIVTDKDLIALNEDHYAAAKWAVDNKEAFFFFTAFMSSMHMPDQRGQIYAGARQLHENLMADLEKNGPSKERTQLVLWVERPDEPSPSLGLVQS